MTPPAEVEIPPGLVEFGVKHGYCADVGDLTKYPEILHAISYIWKRECPDESGQVATASEDPAPPCDTDPEAGRAAATTDASSTATTERPEPDDPTGEPPDPSPDPLPEPPAEGTAEGKTKSSVTHIEEDGPIFLSGYVKAHRKMMANPIWTQLQPSVLKVAIACIFRAGWRDSRWYDGHTEITIPRGSFVTSYRSMAQLTRLTVKQVRAAFGHLSRLQFAAYTRARRYTIVTVTNYEDYQSLNDEEGTDKGTVVNGAQNGRRAQRRAGFGQGLGRVWATDEEVEEVEASSTRKEEEAVRLRSKITVEGSLTGEKTKPFSQNGDDDKRLTTPKYRNESDELVALIRESTGEIPDRKLTRDIRESLELRGVSLRVYLDDVRPRVGRLAQKAGPGFFLKWAKSWGDEAHRPSPEPQEARASDNPAAGFPCCGGRGVRPSGEPCTCKCGDVIRELGNRKKAREAEAVA